jgi:uroporphyrinogen decarboxylase
MDTYSGIDRVKAAFKGKLLDRIPAYPIMGAFTARLFGYPLSKYYKDAKTFAQCQFNAFEKYMPDIVVMMGDLVMEAEGYNCEIDISDEGSPQVKKHVLEDKSKLNLLKQPEPDSSARMPFYLEACERIVTMKLPSPVGSVINGPWATAAAMRGLEYLILDTYDDPTFIHNLMDLTTQTTINFIDALGKVGVGISLSEAPASCSVISPQIYQEFILPYHKKIIAHAASKRMGITIHVCGIADPIRELLIQSAASAFSIDSFTSLSKFSELSYGKFVVIGNVSTQLFMDGTKEDMKKAVQNCLDATGSGKNYILSSGCEIPIVSKPENVACFMQYARDLGKTKEQKIE